MKVFTLLWLVCALPLAARAQLLQDHAINRPDRERAVPAPPADTVAADTAAVQPPPPPPPLWTNSWMINLSGTQAAYRDWSQGGENSVAAKASTLLRFRYRKEHIANRTRFNLRYGLTGLEGDEVRKTDDLINVNNKSEYLISGGHFSAFVEVDFRTQFTKGFGPEYKKVISDFMSPGYFTESIGLSYQPYETFSAQMGVGLKQTFVTIDSLDVYYGLGEDEDIRSEGGIAIAVVVDLPFAGSFNYSGELTTFTNLLESILSTDIRYDNELTGKINDLISLNLQLELYFDDDITKKLQVRQMLAVGFNIKLM